MADAKKVLSGVFSEPAASGTDVIYRFLLRLYIYHNSGSPTKERFSRAPAARLSLGIMGSDDKPSLTLRVSNPRRWTMNGEQQNLLDRLMAFQFDEPGTELTFARRLARENGWSGEYAERVIAEYKRFLFLAMVAGNVVAPSEQV